MKSQLVRDLIADALVPRGRADSQVFQQALSHGPAVVPDLVVAITAPTYDYYLILEAVRTLDRAAYEAIPVDVRIGIYVDALRHARWLNDWGLPGFAEGEARRALVQLGPPVVAALMSLLDDQRPALVLGSQETTLGREYGNRICDYALVLIGAIRQQELTYPRDVAERDGMITEIRKGMPVKH